MADMSGKVCVVTGASTGIGRVTARELGRMGAHVVLACRNREKGEDALREVREQTGGAKAELLLCDFSALNDIRRASAEFLAAHSSLHVLVNNAGAIHAKREETEDGLERTFAVNHLGYFLFTDLLLECLKKSAPSRIVNVASRAHRSGQMHWDDLQYAKSYSSYGAYAQSKLANVLFTRELARRLKGTKVTANCLHPGVVASGFAKNNSGFLKLAYVVGAPFMVSAEKGAETQIYLASSSEVEGVSGGYFAECRPAEPSKIAQDFEAAARLWTVSEQLVRTHN